FPAHKLAGQAHLDIAGSYLHFGRYEDAAKSLQRFLADERYRQREEVPQARYLLGRSFQLQKRFPEALAVWQEYLVKHPAHQAWSAVQREIVDTEFLMAKEKLDAKDYPAAVKLWSEFQTRYPLDARNPEILFWFGTIEHRQEQWDAAIAQWRRLVSKYPGTDWASRGQFMIAATLEEKLGKLDEALEEYKKVTWGPWAGSAQQAIARLTAKRLAVATDRIFRSDETPRLELSTRNLESVTVRAYKVDLETYFRKMHLARGVENLDIALISPDRSFEFPVPKYVKHREIESRVDVPLPGEAKAGVMAVTVGSKTLEATTLVIQSDLDIIVKSSRNEVFVFAQNMRTGKPWPEVKLLISNGKQVFAEGTTGKDGVFRGEFKELADAADVRVFAVAGGHVASNVVGLAGVGVAQGLTDKGYLYTDRPAYRAGQIVHLRGCLRRAAGDAYTIEKDKVWNLDVFESRNRLVHQEKVKLGQFGTFHAHFALPTTSPQGQYRFVVREESGRSFTGTFLVHEYALEPVRLAVDTPRRVYYRGEEIEGTIRAAFYYGAPLAGREIRYQLADDRAHVATTDANGEVRFKLPTREFSETQVLPLVIALPERNLQTTVNFVLACQGFGIEVTTVRPVYVAGETFEVTVKTRDAEGKPIGRKLAMAVLQKTTVEGKVGERLVERHDLETLAADGTARQTLKLAQGGRYVLRVEGTDQFKNPITGEHAVQISDEEDEVRLRILADRHTYQVGDTAAVQLYWREEPALALVTFQGARVLDYKLVELQKGPNKLEVPMTAALAPNFELAVAVMHDARPVSREAKQSAPAGKDVKPKDADAKPQDIKKPVRRFHTASSPFAVERDLRVAVATKRKGDAKGPIRPGEEIEVTVTTTDPQGHPVPAELSLAMVEQSLLERFPWSVPPISEFFRGNLRQTAVRTTSSITFSYRPATKPVNPQLLAEADRREIAREEDESRRRVAAGVEVRSAPDGRVIARGEWGALGGLGGFAPADAVRDATELDAGTLEGVAAKQPASEVVGRPIERLPRRPVAGRVGEGTGFGARGKGSGQLGVAAGTDAPLGQVRAETLEDLDVLVARANQVEVNKALSVIQQVDAFTETLAFDGRTVTTLDAKGRMQVWNLAANGVALDRQQVEAVVAELNRAGAVLLTGLGPQETGYWNPAVVTDNEGKATLTVVVPERTTAWRFLAKGITAETLAGETTADVVVKKDLFGELKLPMAFTDGDEAEVLVTVHNDAIDKGPIEVVLKTTIAGRSVEEKKTIEVTAKGLYEVPFKVTLRRPEPAKPSSPRPQAGEG
ncbi:MAG: MG2 domain-containing protein, partial [Thermoguttaceae bacterium]|nr:MG2 domain-containing protein [Thermoguttaceae bacterium]